MNASVPPLKHEKSERRARSAPPASVMLRSPQDWQGGCSNKPHGNEPSAGGGQAGKPWRHHEEFHSLEARVETRAPSAQTVLSLDPGPAISSPSLGGPQITQNPINRGLLPLSPPSIPWFPENSGFWVQFLGSFSPQALFANPPTCQICPNTQRRRWRL